MSALWPGFVGATDGALIGVLGTIVTGLFGLLGLFIKYLLDQLAKKDADLIEARVAATKALTDSSGVLARVVERLDRDDRPWRPVSAR